MECGTETFECKKSPKHSKYARFTSNNSRESIRIASTASESLKHGRNSATSTFAARSANEAT